KKNGKKPTAAELKMKQTMQLPRGKNIVIIDNVVSTGTSAQAAIQALGGKASVISYAKGRAKKSVVSGLKTTRIETDLFGLIPLDRRGNKANPDVRYSLAGMSSVEYANDISMAAEMYQRGATNSNIYKTTGCIPGFRGKWWKVIDTTADGLKKSVNVSIKNTKTYTMEELYSNADLYKAYPDLKNVTVTVGGNVINTPGAAGAYDPDAGTIKINSMDQNTENARQKTAERK
ncbi:MAG: phosphoribosyltransferase, partial [Blautia sp.]|nr:phosphoribosyltransferase [Blautia sp.]